MGKRISGLTPALDASAGWIRGIFMVSPARDTADGGRGCRCPVFITDEVFNLDKNPVAGRYAHMTFERGNFGFFLAFIIIGGILGSALGTLASKALPVLAFLKQSLTGAIGFNLEILSFSLSLNLAAIIGIALGFILYRKV